tara:strand:- start:7885 stop:8364 length:480 start_codon:yes stop_codon:yes gene_type:complete
MATFNNKDFIKHDDYMTPKYVWENIEQYIPKDKVIWEAFMGDGKSGEYLKDLGLNVIHNDNDFFESNEGDILVSNPPFSKCKEIMPRLKELDKPFILILPSSKINTQYFRIFKNDIQLIIPPKRIQFVKNGNELQNKCNFDCFYYCYKMNLTRDIIWLE